MKRPYFKWRSADLKIITDNPMMTDRELANIIGIEQSKIRSFRRRQKLIKCQKTFSLIGASMLRKNKTA